MLINKAWKLGKEYFFAKEHRYISLGLVLSSVALELLLVYAQVLLIKWSNEFYTSLENLDKSALAANLKYFVVVVTIFIIIFMTKYVLQSYLFIKWRKFLTEKYLDKWSHNASYYGLGIIGNRNDNPDQRISEDLKSFAELSIDLSFGLLRNIVTLFSFIVMLWGLSGVLKFTLLGYNFEITGYLVWAALIYATIDTVVTFKIGRNLPKKDYLQEKKEANFRFSMMRFRENAESIALYKGEKYEEDVFKSSFQEVYDNFISIIKINKNIYLWSNLALNISSIAPILIAAPKLFAKEIKFGGLMQIRLAFMQVQESFAFFANSINIIASYEAVVERLSEFNQTIDNWNELTKNSNIKISHQEKENIILNNLSLSAPDNKSLQKDLNYDFKPGNSYLISGRNGAGKSTLLKALGNIWAFGDGEIKLPKDKSIFFIPQHVYMPFGTLAQAIAYPSIEKVEKEVLESLLKEANLSYLVERLDNEENWSIALSMGEQQKIAMLRAIIHNPDILVMDESSSALNPNDEKKLLQFIKAKLAKSIIISVGHHSSLKEFHDHEIVFA
jgi:vitamin B12/bleomycin/antimicrobial peptide transport system ATP-binding/permease protein